MLNLTAGDARLLQHCLSAALKAHRKMETTVETAKSKARVAESPGVQSAVPIAVTERELATVLHALRVVQDGPVQESAACDHFEDVPELTNPEIDQLCERIGSGPYDALMKAPESEE
jgi:hypothetical protein